MCFVSLYCVKVHVEPLFEARRTIGTNPEDLRLNSETQKNDLKDCLTLKTLKLWQIELSEQSPTAWDCD